MTDVIQLSEPIAPLPPGMMQAIPTGMPSREPVVFRADGPLSRVMRAALSEVDSHSQQHSDPFSAMYATFGAERGWIQPETNPSWLARLRRRSNSLGPLIDAMALNIGGHGYRLVPRLTQDDDRLATFADAADREAVVLRERLKSLHYSPRIQVPQLRQEMRRRAEAVGWGGFEVIRDRRGQISVYEPIFPQLFRWCLTEPEPVAWEQPIFDTERLVWTSRTVSRRFRRYVAFRESDQRNPTYFREFGDPRPMGSRTGAVYAVGAAWPSAKWPDDDPPATELLVTVEIDTTAGAYPMPRWAGSATEIANTYLSGQLNQARLVHPIPPGLILVSGGSLANRNQEEIEEAIAAAQQTDKGGSVIVLEAVGDGGTGGVGAGIAGGPQVKIQWVPLDRTVDGDALYREMRRDDRDAIRATFRLSRVATGELEDVNRAAASAAIAHDEAAVYKPERTTEDLAFFEPLLADWGIRFWTVEGLPAPGLSDEDLPELLKIAVESDAITPEEARSLLARRLRVDLQPYGQPWAQVPRRWLDKGITDPADLDDIEPQATAAPPPIPAGTAEGEPNPEAADLLERVLRLRDESRAALRR